MNIFDLLDLCEMYADAGFSGQDQIQEAAEGSVSSAIENGAISPGSLNWLENFFLRADTYGVDRAEDVVEDIQKAMEEHPDSGPEFGRD